METVKFKNFVIPKGTLALVSLYSLHMDKDYWKDPLVFRPERFLDEYGMFIHHENFMPFGSGNYFSVRFGENFKIKLNLKVNEDVWEKI